MIVMSIAGVDPSAGAGVFADIKTFQACGVYGVGIVTAITAQNPSQVFSIKPIESKFIEEQIDAVLDDYSVEFVKTGMLYSAEIVDAVYDKVREYGLKCVVDPVMVATSGSDLFADDLLSSIEKLLKISIFTTPNVDEAIKLTGIDITNQDTAIDASLKLGEICDNIITGGHLQGINVLNIDGEISIEKQELIETDNLHGSGCNFSSAVTAELAKGKKIKEATLNALDYTYSGILNGNYKTLIPKI